MKTEFLAIVLLASIFVYPQTAPNWFFTQTSASHNIAIPIAINPTVAGIPLTNDDYIGVFYDSLGFSRCAGFVKWSTTVNNAITAWGDDNTTNFKEGFSEGELIVWKVWRRANNTTYIATVAFGSGTATFVTNGTSVLSSFVATQIDTSSVPERPDWTFTVTDINHTIAIPLSATISIEGSPVKSGDYIGVFYEINGEYKCGGYSQYTGSSSIAVAAYGDDATTPAKEGFAFDEVFKWKLWRKSDKKEFFALASYSAVFVNDSLFRPNGTSGLLSLTSTNVQPVSKYFTAKDILYELNNYDVKRVSNYRMIAIPGDTIIYLDKLMKGVAFENWAAFYDDGSDYYLPYSIENKEIFVFKPGNAFWVISDRPIILGNKLQIRNVTISGNNSYSIPLQKGWNMISNPFSFSVPWKNIQFVNSIANDLIFYYSLGRYSSASVIFEPYRGYYFFNRNNLDKLEIPLSVVSMTNKPYSLKADSLKIGLYSEGDLVGSAFIIVNKEFSETLDDYDVFYPPSDLSEYSISFINNNYESEYKESVFESRPIIYDNISFELKVKSLAPIISGEVNKEIELEFDGFEKYTEYEFWLIQQDRKEVFNISEAKSIRLKQTKETEIYKLTAKKKGTFDPAEYKGIADYQLYQNYPNPFNPSTNISFMLKESGNTVLRIYDLLGNEIETLINSPLKAGKHTVKYNADKLNSGIYFYTIVSGNYIETKKMVLIK